MAKKVFDAITALTLCGDAMVKLLQVKHNHTEEQTREAVKLLKHGNPDLFHWLARVIGSDEDSIRNSCESYEFLFNSLVDVAAPFQTGGDLAHLISLGGSTIYQGLKLGIAALRREKAANDQTMLTRDWDFYPVQEPTVGRAAEIAAIDEADDIMVAYIGGVLPPSVWTKWRDKHRAVLCGPRVYVKTREIGCILNVDSPSYPPTADEFRQCAARGCKSCIRCITPKTVKLLENKQGAGGSATARPDAQQGEPKPITGCCHFNHGGWCLNHKEGRRGNFCDKVQGGCTCR